MMKKYQKLNLIVFMSIVIATSLLFYISQMVAQPSFNEKPWHLQPTVHEDSLSSEYKSLYKILGKQRIYQQLKDSSRLKIVILVDAWGVPVQESVLAEDFSFFKGVSHVYALHHRLANRTKHAERTEFQNFLPQNIYIFGGDSMEYDRPKYIREIGFANAVFCQFCSDSVMIEKIDSLLAQDSLKFVAWTTQSSRTGDRDSLHHSLQFIAGFAKRHPEATIVVQGTHRPILGTPETRCSYKAHWVPVAILNNRE